MSTRPAPVTDLAWSAEQAHDFGGQVLDLWTELLERLPGLPVNRELVPAEVAPAVALPVPEEPMPAGEVVAHLRELTFEQSLLVGHPAFFGYILGAGTVPAAATELLAAGLNPCLGGYRLGAGAAEIELHLTRWLAERFGLPEGAGGMMMSGGAMANFTALKCARDAALGIDVREQGVREHGPVALYASEEAHVVIRRAADMLGLGAGAVRAIAIDRQQRMRSDALEEAIRRDLDAGVRPLAVCATAGTTTTGSIDPLPAIAAIAAVGSIDPVVVVPAVTQAASGRTPAARSRAIAASSLSARMRCCPSISTTRTALAPRPSMSAARRITTCASSDA